MSDDPSGPVPSDPPPGRPRRSGPTRAPAGPEADPFPDELPPNLDAGWKGRVRSSARITLSAARLGARRILRREGPMDVRLGEEMARELDRMKGMAMKVGQILSYFDGILPDETQAALRSLQTGVTRMSWDRVQDVVEGSFGREVGELFSEFSREPVASASIGQVHRAVFQGKQVAVKVQYPGVGDTILTDFGRLRTLGRFATLGTAADGLAIVEELRERVVAECDYVAEAKAQTAFRKALADGVDVDVPEVILPRTRPTVLTSGWRDGESLYDFVARAPQSERDRIGRVLLGVAHRSFFELGVVNADPHPGNFLFPAGGPVVLLDFGCVRRFPPAFVEAERRTARAVLDGRPGDFREAVLASGIVATERGFDWDSHWKMMKHHYAPYLERRFRFGPGHLRRGLEFGGPGNPNMRKLRVPPEWIWLQRLQWGIHAVLARLEAQGSFSDLLRRSLETPLVGLEPAV